MDHESTANTSADAGTSLVSERVAELTFESSRHYADPFNDLDVDVIFERGGDAWRVPAFWHGGSRWTVRFAPPVPGEYTYRLVCSDDGNPDLHGQRGQVTITPYDGDNDLLSRGPLRVNQNGRYLEHSDGTPFYWLGDTWWTGLSDRLPWDGFQRLTADRKDKGFTLIQLVAGLVPGEEVGPDDPGFHNEGGYVWGAEFNSLNPEFFDYADRRISHLVDQGLVPAIVGAWFNLMDLMGPEKMKQHWRYVIARYGCYPVVWILGGEVVDPPEDIPEGVAIPEAHLAGEVGTWTDVARYVRAVDPYRHPLTVHERPPFSDVSLQDESLTDLDLFQSGHSGWQTITTEVAQMNRHYARTTMVKPIVQGEIGYEKLGEQHLEDFQRAAFWLTMLNGGAGHTYGANGTWEAYSADKPLHRWRWSFLTWEEGMRLPGSTQVGLGAKLLQRYPWWRFEPRPDWVIPHGTTLLEPTSQINGFTWDDDAIDVRHAYAAGISGEVRVIYIAAFGLHTAISSAPTVLGLEPGIRYHAYFWEPALGMTIDLGAVERPTPGTVIFTGDLSSIDSAEWTGLQDQGGATSNDKLAMVKDVHDNNIVATLETRADTAATLLVRYRAPGHHLAAVYDPTPEPSISIVERREGQDDQPLATVAAPDLDVDGDIRLSIETRDKMAAISVTDGTRTYTGPIVTVSIVDAGMVGLTQSGAEPSLAAGRLEIRRSPTLVHDDHLERDLYDAWGQYRGNLDIEIMPKFKRQGVPGLIDLGREKHILLDAYRPQKLPTGQDWVLVLET